MLGRKKNGAIYLDRSTRRGSLRRSSQACVEVVRACTASMNFHDSLHALSRELRYASMSSFQLHESVAEASVGSSLKDSKKLHLIPLAFRNSCRRIFLFYAMCVCFFASNKAYHKLKALSPAKKFLCLVCCACRKTLGHRAWRGSTVTG